jgi:hypothetical protein
MADTTVGWSSEGRKTRELNCGDANNNAVPPDDIKTKKLIDDSQYDEDHHQRTGRFDK